jgi:hypothetical protein
MIWTFKFQPAQNLLEILYEGESSVEDSIRAKQEYLSSPLWQPGMNILVDFRQTHIKSTALDELRKTAKFNEERQNDYGHGRIAYLVKSKHDYGIVRQMISLMEIYTLNEVQPFMCEQAAREWLTGEGTEPVAGPNIESLFV